MQELAWAAKGAACGGGSGLGCWFLWRFDTLTVLDK
jgi:hypothetical protein